MALAGEAVTAIAIGQVWESKDTRDHTRRVRVIGVDERHAKKVMHRNLVTDRLAYSQPSTFTSTFRLIELPVETRNAEQAILEAAPAMLDEIERLRIVADAWQAIAIGERERCAAWHEAEADRYEHNTATTCDAAIDDALDSIDDALVTYHRAFAGLIRALQLPEAPK